MSHIRCSTESAGILQLAQQPAKGTHNTQQSRLRAHTTHSAVSVVAVAAVLATTTKYNHKANFETKGKSRQFFFLLHPAVQWAKTTLITNPGEGPSVFSSSGVFLVVEKDQPDKERKQKRKVVSFNLGRKVGQ